MIAAHPELVSALEMLVWSESASVSLIAVVPPVSPCNTLV
jgi:hypothetical protein